MADFETKVRVSAQTAGFDKVQQEGTKLVAAQTALNRGLQATTKSTALFKTTLEKAMTAFNSRKAKDSVGQLEQAVGDLNDQLMETVKTQAELTELLMGVEKGSEAYGALESNLAGVNTQAEQLQRMLGMLEKAWKQNTAAADKAKGAFSQGFAQGAGVGEYLPRGPGAMKQAAGRMLGRATIGIPGGVAKGLAQTPFSGAGGVVQALSSIPGGGMLAAPLQAAMGFSGRALAFQQQQQQAMPFLNAGGGLGRAMAGGRARARATSEKFIEESYMAGARGPVDSDKLATAIADKTEEAKFKGTEKLVADYDSGALKPGYLGGAGSVEMLRKGYEARGISEAGGTQGIAAKAEEKIRDENARTAMRDAIAGKGAREKQMGESAGRGRLQSILSDFGKAGREVGGMTKEESLQYASQVGGIGGGGPEALQKSGLLRAGMAAKTQYGVSENVTGQMLEASRRGGVVGGAGGDQMAQMIADAMKMGLEGSEITGYMEEMAQGIVQFQQTGIPLNPDSMREVGTAFGMAGLGGMQAQRLRQGMVGKAEQVGTQGPEGAVDMLMMQTMGGFKGGGVKEWRASKRALSEKKFAEGGMEKFLQGIVGAGGGDDAVSAEVVENVFRQMGMPLGPGQAEDLVAGTKGNASPEQKEKIAEFEAQSRAGAAAAPKDQAALEAGAAETLALTPGAKRQRSLEDKQLGIGAKMLPAVQAFEEGTTKAATGISNFADKLNSLGEGAKKVADGFQALTEWISNKTKVEEAVVK